MEIGPGRRKKSRTISQNEEKKEKSIKNVSNGSDSF